jgi:aminomethyltransferase
MSTTPPLYAFHKKYHARFIDFVGWYMPVQYTSILEEHRAVRTKVGLFDVSHLGQITITGQQSQIFLDMLVTNDVSALKPGTALYSCMCREHGGVVDDLIIYCLSHENYLLCINSANTDKDIHWMQEQASAFHCKIINVSNEYALLALQGPQAKPLLSNLCKTDLSRLKRFTFINTEVAGIDMFVCRTGYTGEDGYEFYCPVAQSEKFAIAIYQTGHLYGLKLCGLGARDSLRLEAGYPLYGHEIDEHISPLQANLDWTVKFNKKSNFIGRSALEKEKLNGIQRRIVHFILQDRRIAREGTTIFNTDKEEVGTIVSGTLSPMLGLPIGSALIKTDQVNHDNLYVNLRGHTVPVNLKKPPLHRT